MRRFFIITICVFLLITIFTATIYDDQKSYRIKINVEAGMVFRYRYNFTMNIGNQQTIVRHTIIQKVLQVRKDGSTIMEGQVEAGTVQVGNSEFPAQPSAPTRVYHAPDGKVTRVVGNATSIRMARLNSMVYPKRMLKIGDRWRSYLLPQGDAPRVKQEFELIGVEKVGSYEALKIKFTAREISRGNAKSVYEK